MIGTLFTIARPDPPGVIHSPAGERGFSLVEILVVLGILSVMYGIASGITLTSINQSRADSATIAVISALDLARNRATSERRDFQLVFTVPNQIVVSRLEVPSGSSTPISKTYLANGQTFLKFTGLPDTPDAFGATSAISFGSTPTIRFTSDGSLIDSSGDILNGSLFLGEPSKVPTARAVTIFGATGLMRTWKWNGVAWQ